MKNTSYNQLVEMCHSYKGELITFLHNTTSKDIAEEIMSYGFEFNSHLDYTCDVVSAKDPLTIKYFRNVREAYGNYTIIIQIGRNIIMNFSEALDKTPHHFSEVLSVCKPKLNDDNESIYKLAPHFIKGYLNQSENIFCKNPTFNPHKEIDLFDQNLKQLLNAD